MDITGASTATDGVVALLAMLNDDVVFRAKIDALNVATAENRLILDAVGPASEIIQIRSYTVALRDAAVQALSDAKAQADAVVNDATALASQITSKAIDDANAIKAQANAMMTDALTQQKQSRLDAQAVEVDRSFIDGVRAALDQALSDAVVSKTAADQAAAASEAERQSIIAKHEQFLAALQ